MLSKYQVHINDCITKKEYIYTNNHEEMVASYRREKAIVSDYNGRQIMELIQNCDDQESDKVLIELNTGNRTISISNRGKAFDESGYSSLFVDNLSPKMNKKQFIGNKGLGFRSILNWADQIKVISNDIALIYSEDSAKRKFDELFDITAKETLWTKYSNKKEVALIPILAFPEVQYEQVRSEYVTTIEITYKEEYLDDIETQINCLDENLLLFLKHIEEIHFEGFNGKQDFKSTKYDLNNKDKQSLYANQKIELQNKDVWYIYRKEGQLPQEYTKDNLFEEAEYFEIKIAFNKANIASKKHFLYSYFPTQIELSLPILLHITFDLTSNRNEVVNSKKNIFIAHEAANFIKEIALTMTKLSQSSSNWDAYNILYTSVKHNSLKAIGFYEPLEEALRNENIYPCIDNGYRSLSRICILSEKLVDLIKEISNGSHVFPEVLQITDNYIPSKNTIINFENKINSLELTNFEQRAQLIHELHINFKKSKFNLLVNKQGEVINNNSDVFTPALSSIIEIPTFCKLEFIHKDLYNALLSEFNISSNYKAREISRYLDESYNLKDFEPGPLAAKIIAESKLYLGKEDEETVNKAAIKALYNIFRSNPNSEIRSSMLVRAKDGILYKAETLVFSDSYPIGKDVENIFKNVYSEMNYLCSIEYYEFDKSENIQELEKFFSWLGVNAYAQYNDDGILNFHNIVNKIERENLIYWIHCDGHLYNLIKNSKKNNALIINNKFKFENYLIENKYLWFNENPINYDHSLFKVNELSRTTINSILISLGAKEDAIDLDLERIQYIVDQLPKELPNGQNSQTIYKRVMKDGFSLKNDTFLFAEDGKTLQLYPSSEIYFSEKVILPRQLKTKYPIFNFSARSGGKSAISFFQINDLNKVKIEVSEHTLSEKNRELCEFIEKLKPFMLASKLSNINDDETKKGFAKRLRELDIVFCDTVTIIAKNETFILFDEEYVLNSLDSHYYVKINRDIELTNSLKRRPLARALSEIFAQALDVSFEKSGFELEISYAFDSFRHLKDRFRSEMSNDSVLESEELLSIATPKTNFINTICDLIGLNFEEDKEKIANDFDINKIDFNDWLNDSNQIIVYNILIKNKITIKDWNLHSENKIDFSKKHRNTIKNILQDKDQLIACSIWESLIGLDISQKQKFLDIKSKFLRYNIENIALNYKNSYTLNEDNIFNKIVNDLYNNLDISTSCKWTDIEKVYNTNKGLFNQSDFFLIEEIPTIESLLYFKNTKNDVDKYLNEKKAIISNKKTEPSIKAPEVIPTLIDGEFKAYNLEKNINSQNGVYRHSSTSNYNNKEKGKTSEEKVYIYLKAHYEKINNTRVYDDGLHYDMSYFCPERNMWIYVEVKTFDIDKFSLSKEQFEYGKENKKRYEIWLVKGDNLYKIDDLFDREIDNKYNIVPDGYIIYTKLAH